MSQVIPDSWVNSKLEDVVDSIVGGGTPSKAVSSYFQGDIPWMSVKDMNKNELVDTVDHISQEAVENSSTNVIPAGTPIVATRMSLGKIVTASFDSAINQDLKALFVNLNVEKPYLVYWYRSIANLIESLGTGTTVKGIRLEILKGLEFPLPPLAEQKVIADKLDELLAQVESTKARLDAIPTILKSFRQAVLAAAVSGKLTEEFGSIELAQVDIKSEWIQYQELIFEKTGKRPKSSNWLTKSPSPKHLNQFSDLLPSNKKWNAFYLDDIILGKNQGVNTTTEKVEYSNTGVMAIQAGNVVESHILFQTDKFVSTDKFESLAIHVKPNPNDVLYTNIGANFGNAAVVPEACEPFLITWNVMKIIPSKLLIPKYLEIVLNSNHIRVEALKAVSTSTVPFVNGKTIGQYVIPTPPLDEQTEIVRRVEALFAFADKVEAQVNAAQARVNNLTQSILAKAFRGELTADWRAANPELISGDNSASALLKRIKAERAKLKPVKKTTAKKAKA